MESLAEANLEEDDCFRPFFAVLEKQGQCEFYIRPAADSTPHLFAAPTADSRAQVPAVFYTLVLR
jgi:hypothetical protein